MGVEMTYTREGSFGVVGVNGYAVCRKGGTIEVHEADVPGLEDQGFVRGGGDGTPANDASGETDGEANILGHADTDDGTKDEVGPAEPTGGGGRGAVVDDEAEETSVEELLHEISDADKGRLIEIGRALDIDFSTRWGARRIRKAIREALEG